MTLTDFLLARIAEDMGRASQVRLVYIDDRTGVLKERQRSLSSRVLAECKAKRRIVENATSQHTSGPDWDDACRLLALPYADHPDYREEWKP